MLLNQGNQQIAAWEHDTATLAADEDAAFGPTTLKRKPGTVRLVFAVGEFPDTFTYIVNEIPTFRDSRSGRRRAAKT